MSDFLDGSGRADGHWLTADRLKVYPLIFLAVFTVSAGIWAFLSNDLIDPGGKPIGTDFITFWGASHLALAGRPEAAFDLQQIFEAERGAVAGLTNIFAWHYPPTFELIIMPLATLPYLVSYLAWTGLTMAAYVGVVRKLAPMPQTVWLILAFPATFVNFGHGQTGFLTTALFGGGILLLERRPIAAGILIGLLSYKPHFGLLLPLVLMAGNHWRAFITAAITTILFALLSALVLGPESWIAFWNNLPLARQILSEGGVPWEKMPGLFTALRLLGINAATSYVMQAVLAAGVAAATAWIWWKRVPIPLAGAVLVSGSLLVTPYAFDYDLALLAIPIALLAWDGHQRGWLAGEREILVAAWLLPVVAPAIAAYTSVQIGILCLGALFFVAVRRAALSADDAVRARPAAPSSL